VGKPTRRPLAELLASLPPEGAEDLGPALREALRAAPAKVAVLDDDPTGTQTVHGIPVLTEASTAALGAEFANDLPAFYILTNSRSLPLADARALNAEVGARLREAAARAGRPFAVVSRSDSTLRGHFPGEVEALAGAVGGGFDAWLLIPFFQEGGRYTVGDTHYVAEGDVLVPAGETEFARDAVFGYRASDLREWVAEKTGGRVAPADVASVSIDDLRRGGPERIAERLASLTGGRVGVVNAASRRDLEVFTLGLLAAEAAGKRFLYRTAASFVPVRAGIPPRPLLGAEEVAPPGPGGGLIVAGSYVPKTTAQLEGLLGRPGIAAVEMDVECLLSDARREEAIRRAAAAADAALARNEDAVVFTSRRLVTAGDAESNLAIGRRVSDGLVEVVRRVATRPRYVLAKGGITSSDVATRGLGVRRAMVLGQILPGVPVWKLGPETRHPGLSYIVFPGNVGGPGALAQVTAALRGERGP
jgi:uncharacterized protein YgbK (DUF1537 family)